MTKTRISGAAIGIMALIIGSFAITQTASADHAWGHYHWARTANPFTLKIGNNLTSTWNPYLVTTVVDWSVSSVVDMAIVPGGTLKNVRNCRATPGQVEVCNTKYGFNGWLGVASIWAYGDHITQGTVKMNDSYFNTSTYNSSAWRNLVLCQEVGHTLGLDHQDETFANANLNTCMDYTNNPSTNQHPNTHDYEMLETIYAHLDTTTTLTQSNASSPADIDTNDPKNWGQEIRRSKDGGASLFEKDLGNGHKVFTHVFWAEPRHSHK